jgi:hypothetical protein
LQTFETEMLAEEENDCATLPLPLTCPGNSGFEMEYMLCALAYSPIARSSSAGKERDMTESSDDSSNSTPTKRGEIDPRLKLVTGQGGGVLIIGGMQPPRMPEGLPHEKSSPSTGTGDMKTAEETKTGDSRARN